MGKTQLKKKSFFILPLEFGSGDYQHHLLQKECHFNTSKKAYFIILAHHFIIHSTSYVLFFNSIY